MFFHGEHVAGARQGRETRRTHGVPKKKYCDDLTKPRKVHCKAGWKHFQNAVYWIHLGRAQEKGTAFWRTKSHAIITNSAVPLVCVERVTTQRGEMTIYQRSSTPRLALRVVIKSAWHEQRQQDVLRSCWQYRVRGPKPQQCCERRMLVNWKVETRIRY